MNLRQELKLRHPEFPLLEASDLGGVAALFRRLGWLEPDERVVACDRAGEGNMNLTLRVRTDRRSVILKQSRPWVEKYDHIAAPLDRALIEQRFYQRSKTVPEVAAAMPELLATDEASRTLLLEDLGEASDLTSLYRGGELAGETVTALGRYLAALHRSTRGEPAGRLSNAEMRRLNHEHIFRVPFQRDNGVPLCDYEPGLEAVASELRDQSELLKVIDDLGERYLGAGGEVDEAQGEHCLVHGDFFPGSWLSTSHGLRVIDPEFGFYGDRELDFGVAVAHLALARQSFEHGVRLVETATPDAEWPPRLELVARYAGIEIIRRLLGVAQLPIPPSDGWRSGMLERAQAAIDRGELEPFRE